MTLNFGSTTIALTGWMIDPEKPEMERIRRLDAIRKLVNGYHLQAVELTLDLHLLYPEVYNQVFYQQVADLQNELGFKCSVHLPFIWLDCSSLNEEIRSTSVRSILNAFEIISPLNVSSYVAHMWGITTMNIIHLGFREGKEELILRTFQKQAHKSLEVLTKTIDPKKLCVETLVFPDFDFILPAVQDTGAGICLDTGHVASSDTPPAVFLEQYHDIICEIHLHDALPADGNRIRSKGHLPLGTGEISIQNFLEKLEEFKFQGNIIIENNSQSDLEKSLAYLEQLSL